MRGVGEKKCVWGGGGGVCSHSLDRLSQAGQAVDSGAGPGLLSMRPAHVQQRPQV